MYIRCQALAPRAAHGSLEEPESKSVQTSLLFVCLRCVVDISCLFKYTAQLPETERQMCNSNRRPTNHTPSACSLYAADSADYNWFSAGPRRVPSRALRVAAEV